MEPGSIWTILRRRIRVIIVGVVVTGLTAGIVSMLMPRTYESQTTLIVGQSLTAINPDYNQLLASQRLSQTYVDVAKTRPILTAVISKLGLDVTPDDLAKHISATAGDTNSLLTISVDATDPDSAARIANAIAAELITVSPTIQGQRSEILKSIDDDLSATRTQIDDTQAQLDDLTKLPNRTAAQEAELQTLQSRLTTLRATYSSLLSFSSNSSANQLSVIEPAAPSSDPSSPRVPINILIGLVIGLVIGLSVAFVSENLDDSLKTADDVQGQLGLPTLGSIIRMPNESGRNAVYSVATLTYPRSPGAEAFRALRTNLEFAGIDSPLRTILVTSAVPGEGKTTVAANLAVAFAQTGRRTILLDADLRRPELHRLLDVDDSIGLTTLLRADYPSLEIVAQPTQEPSLRVVASGPLPPNPADLLGSKRMQAVFELLRESADLVVVDSPPLELVTDAAVLASYVDGTLLVVQAGRSRRGSTRAARETLSRVGARVLGVALNRVTRPSAEYLYHYSARDGKDTPESARQPLSPSAPG